MSSNRRSISLVFWSGTSALWVVLWVVPASVFLVAVHQHGPAQLTVVVLTCVVSGIAAVLLPDVYFTPRPFEKDGRVYEWLGVRLFKRIVKDGDYMNLLIRRAEPGYRVMGGRDGLSRFAAQTRSSETHHLLFLLMTLTPIVYCTAAGWYGFAVYSLAVNLPMNIYPVMLQRYNRVRIGRVVDRPQGKGNKT